MSSVLRHGGVLTGESEPGLSIRLGHTPCLRLHAHSSLGRRGTTHMLYAILCYDSEDVVGSWTREEEEAVMAELAAVQQKLASQGRLGPVARLLPTTAATTVRKGREPLLIDGPFAETKEQLLGFYVVDCPTLEEAIETARDLARASRSPGAYEIRPLAAFKPGSGLA